MMPAALQCEGSNHRAGSQGHEVDAPAAWHVTMRCPSCDWQYAVNLCAPRVRFIRSGTFTMTCGECGVCVPWARMWREVTALADFVPRIGVAEPVASAADVSPATLVSEFVAYMESRQQSPGTIRLRRRHVEELRAEFANLDTVTPDELDAYMRERSRHVKPATINSMIKSIRAFYKWADRYGVIRPNPTTLLDFLPNPHRMGRIVSDEALASALAVAPANVRAMLLLGRLAGLRLSEIAGLRADARSGDWLTIIGKGDKQRRVYIVPELARALDAIAPDGEYYFPGATDGHMHPQSVHKIIKRHAGINPHALRHAAGTAAYRASKDLRATQAFLGHADPGTTAIYVHVGEDDLRSVAEAGAMVSTLGTRPPT